MTKSLSNDQIFIRKLTDIIHANLTNKKFGVKKLIQESGMSLYTLSRKLNSINHKTINQFIREVRLHKAREILQNEAFTVSEVAYRVGFNSPAYFNTCFHKFFGYPPGEVKKNDQESPEENMLNLDIIKHVQNKPLHRTLVLKLILSLAVIVVIVTLFVFPRFRRDTLESISLSGGRISLAVMPFQNMTNDTTWNLWRDAIQQSLISSLSNTRELKVRQKEYINTLLQTHGLTDYAGISATIAGTISKKIDADIFIYGSIQKAGPAIRVDAQLIDTRTKEVLKSFNVKGLSENAFQIVDTLSQRLRNFLLISKLIKENPEYGRFPLSTTSPEAFRYCIYGDEAKNTAINKEGFSAAIDWYLKALAIDSNFYYPIDGLSFAYANLGMMEQSIKWIIKAYQKRNQWPITQQIGANLEYVSYFGSPDEKIRYLKQFQQIDDQTPGISYVLGVTYNEMKQYGKAIPELEKAISIYHRWGINDSWYYSELGYAYHKAGQYKKEKKLYKTAEKYVKEDQWIIARRAILSLSEEDTIAAKSQIEKMASFLNENSFSEAEIKIWIARVYREAGNPDKAEEYYRKALSCESDNASLLNTYANFLVESNRNLNEFIVTIDKALELAANQCDYYNYLDTKGYGLYKFGKYQEGLEVLQKAWNLAPFKLYFIKSHFEEAKKAVAGMK